MWGGGHDLFDLVEAEQVEADDVLAPQLVEAVQHPAIDVEVAVVRVAVVREAGERYGELGVAVVGEQVLDVTGQGCLLVVAVVEAAKRDIAFPDFCLFTVGELVV